MGQVDQVAGKCIRIGPQSGHCLAARGRPNYLYAGIGVSLRLNHTLIKGKDQMSKGQDSKKEAKKKPSKTMKEKKDVKKAKKADKK